MRPLIAQTSRQSVIAVACLVLLIRLSKAVAQSIPPGEGQCFPSLRPFSNQTHKQIYTVGVLAIRGFESAFNEFNKTFADYLTATAGTRFNPSIRFQLKPLNFELLFSDVEDAQVDFLYVNPSAFSCIESEYGANTLVSQISRRIVGGREYDLTKFGGVIFTRADNEEVNTIRDLKDKIIAAASISGLGSGQMQFRRMIQEGLSFIQDPKQLVLTSNQGKVVNGVLQRKFEVGFVRTDQIERTKDDDTGELVNKLDFKIIEPQKGLEIDGEPFPFESSTVLYAEWNVASLQSVPDDVAQEVQVALLGLADHAEVGAELVACYQDRNCSGINVFDDQSDCEASCLASIDNSVYRRCDTNPDVAVLASEAKTNGRYTGWRSTLSYMDLRNMQEETGFISKDPESGVNRCIRSKEIYDAVVCPQGFFRKSQEEVLKGCVDAGLECAEGFQCLCSPCLEGFNVDVFPIIQDEPSRAAGCPKFVICGTVEQRDTIAFRAVDNEKRDSLEMTVTVLEGEQESTIKARRVSVDEEPFAYEFDFDATDRMVGVVILEIRADGEQISVSPLRLQVLQRDCQDAGDLRVADEFGNCVCEDNSVEIGNKCIPLAVLLPLIFVPISLLVCVGVYLYVERKKKQADSVWAVKPEELHFDDPPEVLGRGTFGLVLLAEYRGTNVAVKRVIPPRVTNKVDKARLASKLGSGDVRMTGSTAEDSSGVVALKKPLEASARTEEAKPGALMNRQGSNEEASQASRAERKKKSFFDFDYEQEKDRSDLRSGRVPRRGSGTSFGSGGYQRRGSGCSYGSGGYQRRSSGTSGGGSGGYQRRGSGVSCESWDMDIEAIGEAAEKIGASPIRDFRSVEKDSNNGKEPQHTDRPRRRHSFTFDIIEEHDTRDFSSLEKDSKNGMVPQHTDRPRRRNSYGDTVDASNIIGEVDTRNFSPVGKDFNNGMVPQHTDRPRRRNSYGDTVDTFDIIEEDDENGTTPSEIAIVQASPLGADDNSGGMRSQMGTASVLISGSIGYDSASGTGSVNNSWTYAGKFGKRRIKHLLFGNRDEYARLEQEFVHEMRTLSKLRHPCITTVMGAVIAKGVEPMLIMEFMDFGSLYDLLHNESMVMDGELVLPILRDIAQGVRFLHAAEVQVIHGDLKAQNVLVDSKFRAKVADFGLTQKKRIGATGTPLWMAPELLRGESENTAASDVYSFGIILYEVYSREDPYFGEDYREVLRLVVDPKVNKRPPVPKTMPSKVSSLMTDCLVVDPESRPTFEEVDLRLKRLDVDNVEPGRTMFSLQRKKELQMERSEDLLFKVFPKHVAEALRDGRKVEPESHDCCTVFFSDIVGYTNMSANLPARKVSDMLDRLYHRFDELSVAHDVFKIETIGDAYMAVTNLATEQPNDHVKRMAEFAMDAVDVAGETLIDLDDPNKGYVQIRVGFHSGPLVANVVGSRCPKYTLFGDTVNTSSRMESMSLPGRIQCSERSADLIIVQAPEIKLTSRGKISIKGKGEMQTFWVNEEAPPGSIIKSITNMDPAPPLLSAIAENQHV